MILNLHTEPLPYRSELHITRRSVEEYIARFHDAERIAGYCRACPNYGRSWACPPYDFDPEEVMRPYRFIHIVASRIYPAAADLPFSESGRLIIPERRRLMSRLLHLEKLHAGRSFSYMGSCLNCPAGTCTRLSGQPCRHPELVRPSLEAFGFDIGKSVEELFGFGLKWSNNGLIPEYLTLVGGFIHNNPDLTDEDFLFDR